MKLDDVTKLHELLEIAYNDMQSVKANPAYKFDVQQWHEWDETNKVCVVCVAGAVIAGQLNLKPQWSASPDKLVSWKHITRKGHVLLHALDSLRHGGLSSSFMGSGIEISHLQLKELRSGLKGLRDGDSRSWRALWLRAKKADL